MSYRPSHPHSQPPQSRLLPQPSYPRPHQSQSSQPRLLPQQPRPQSYQPHPPQPRVLLQPSQQPPYQPQLQRFPQPQFQGVYLGKRDDTFKQMIGSILETGDISEKYVDELLTPEGMSYFSTAFTHETADRENNYQFMETLGDATLNTCTVWYLAQRFPQIRCKAGSDIFTKLKIKLVQSKSYGKMASELGFWDFISMEKNLNEAASVKDKQSILEDVFESCFAAIQLLLDSKFGIGVGHVVCYKIISKILDKKNIRIDYEQIVDAKTRLKEMFDKSYNKQRYGDFYLVVTESSDAHHNVLIYFGPVHLIEPFKKTKTRPPPNHPDIKIIGTGQSNESLADAEQVASQAALDYLKKEYNLVKEVPPEYIRFCT